MKANNLFIFLFLNSILTACSPDIHVQNTDSNRYATLEHIKGRWTYFSLRSNKVIGICDAQDSIAINRFSKRMDWDVAFCDGMIKTNSGSSGIGHGGIALSEKTYDQSPLDTEIIFIVDSIRDE